MMFRLFKFFLFLAFVFPVSQCLNFRCPDILNCLCSTSDADEYNILCRFGRRTAFGVNVRRLKPEINVKVQCIGNPNLSELHPNLITHPVSALYVQSCGLSENFTLVNLAERLNALETQSLYFVSYRNQSDRLKAVHFSGFSRVKVLVLSENDFSKLPSDIFSNLADLEWLDLTNNYLTELPVNVFSGNVNLRVLRLGNNVIQSIRPGTFDTLTNLEDLSIQRNRLRTIETGTFNKLKALQILDISSNLLEGLSPETFSQLTNLLGVILNENNFTELPRGLFSNNRLLETVFLQNNTRKLATLPNGLFSNLQKLELLSLSGNGLTALPENVFWNSSSIQDIDLEDNYLVTLPRDIFRDLKQLKNLKLGFNKLESLPDEIFLNARELEVLDLSGNRFTYISRNLFTGLTSLRELNMNDNQLSAIDDQSFYHLRSLQIAKFSNNMLTLETSLQSNNGRLSPFHRCSALVELHLDRNNVSEIFVDWRINDLQLTKLDLQHNNIRKLVAGDLQFLSNSISVDLRHNFITHIDLSHAEQLANDQTKRRDVKILLDENPLDCDCRVHDLLRYFAGEMSNYVGNMFVLDADNLRCDSPESRKGTLVKQLNTTNFVYTCKRGRIIPDKQ